MKFAVDHYLNSILKGNFFKYSDFFTQQNLKFSRILFLFFTQQNIKNILMHYATKVKTLQYVSSFVLSSTLLCVCSVVL